MPGRSIRVARIAGIPVGVSPWWLVIVALFTWMLGASCYPSVVHGIAPATAYGLGLLSILLLFASILAHEFGHALVARRCGIEVEEIDLWLLGGVSKLRGRAQTPVDELRFAAAGPAVTAVIAAIFGAVALLLPGSTRRRSRPSSTTRPRSTSSCCSSTWSPLSRSTADASPERCCGGAAVTSRRRRRPRRAWGAPWLADDRPRRDVVARRRGGWRGAGADRRLHRHGRQR
jgi:Zn-dependent protease